jgi:Ca2+-binding RTX toxin-like protein
LPAGLTHVLTIQDDPALLLAGVSDVAILESDGRVMLYTAGEAEAGIDAFEILPGYTASHLAQIAPSPVSGTDGITDLLIYSVGTARFLLPGGRFVPGTVTWGVNPDATFGAAKLSGWGDSKYSWTVNAEAVKIGTSTYVYASSWDKPGLKYYKADASGGLLWKANYADTTTAFRKNITDIESANLYKKNFLFIASGTESGVESFRIGSTGALTFADRSGPSEKWGMGGPTALETVKSGGAAFLVVAASESDSLTTMSVSSTGMLKPLDRMTDTLETRFGGVQALATFQVGQRGYVVAGGGDDGVTLLRIDPYGHLSVLATYADTFDTALANVSAIEVRKIHGIWTAIVAGAADHGVTLLQLDLGSPGSLYKGTSLANTVTGTALEDELFGNGGNDKLNGGDGDDRLSDGTGTDTLTGGPGADIFEFADDGVIDRITDFETGIDRIDLSLFPLIYHFSELVITPTAAGYDIVLGNDRFILTLAFNASSETFVFDQGDFIFG